MALPGVEVKLGVKGVEIFELVVDVEEVEGLGEEASILWYLYTQRKALIHPFVQGMEA